MKLYIRDFDTRSIVKEIDVTGHSERQVEKIMMGMLINMNTEDYFVDDSDCEFDDEGQPIERAGENG